MAKRAPLDEKPFRPLDVSVINSVVRHVGESRHSNQPEEALARDRPRAPSPERAPNPLTIVRKLDQEIRILFTRQERQALDRMVTSLAIRLQTQVKVSHVIRALTSLLLNAEAHVDIRAGERGPLTRPANGDVAGLELFEQEISILLSQAIRDAAPPRRA